MLSAAARHHTQSKLFIRFSHSQSACIPRHRWLRLIQELLARLYNQATRDFANVARGLIWGLVPGLLLAVAGRVKRNLTHLADFND